MDMGVWLLLFLAVRLDMDMYLPSITGDHLIITPTSSI